jgi:hypothetical protein
MAHFVFREPRKELVQLTFRKTLDLLCYLFDGRLHIIPMISNFVQKINIFGISSVDHGDVVHNYHNFRPSEFLLLIAIAMAEVPTPNLLAISAIYA